MGFRNPVTSLSGSQITPGTIIGSTVETADTGTRVVLTGNGTPNNFGVLSIPEVGFYTGDAGEISHGRVRSGVTSPGEVAAIQAGYVEIVSPDLGSGYRSMLIVGTSRDGTIPGHIATPELQVGGVLTATSDVDVTGVLRVGAGELIPPGVVLATAMWTPGGTIAAPPGWLACDGSAVSRTTYARLWAVVGTTYGGGDGSTTFNLPNLCGRVVVGIDPTASEFNTIGQAGGEKYHALTGIENGPHTHQLDSTGQNVVVNSPGAYGAAGGTNWGFKYPNTQNNTEASGSGSPHNNLQPYISLSYIIRY